MDNNENMQNTEPTKPVWDVNIINTNGKFYKRWDMLIIYDNFLQLPFQYINGKRKDMDRGSFNDYADEITEKDQIDTLFTDKIKQEYINTLQEVYEKFKKNVDFQSKKNKGQINELEKRL